jgi:hypothetical protein
MEELKSGIYKITCLKNGKVYVGQAQDIKERWKEHKRGLTGNYHHNIHLQRAWNKYGEKHFKFEIIEYVKLLDEREIYWIEKLDTFKNGYNRTLGGGGTLGRKYTEEEIENRTGENNPFYNKKHKDGWLEMVINASNEKTSRPVIQIDSNNGEIISRYNSMSEASRAFGISPTAIQLCTEGINKRACGYYWVLEEKYDSFEFSPFVNKSIRKVCQIDFQSGKLLNIFDSMEIASNMVNTPSSNITACCNGKQKSCCDYFWKHYEIGDEYIEYFDVPKRNSTNGIRKGSI